MEKNLQPWYCWCWLGDRKIFIISGEKVKTQVYKKSDFDFC